MIDYERPWPRFTHILAAIGFWIGAIAAISVFCVALWFAAAGAARAHEHEGFKFDGWCCQGNNVNGDCQPIPLSSVTEIVGGYQITLGPGDHPMVTRVHVFQMEQSKVRWTDNGQAYACLYPSENELRCLYLPPPGS